MSPDEELERLKAAIVRIHGFLEKGDVSGAMGACCADEVFGEVEADPAVGADAYDMSQQFFEMCKTRGIQRAAYVAVAEGDNENSMKLLIGGEQTLGRMLSQFTSLYFGKAIE